MLAAFDPWILAFSLVTVAVTIWMGFRSAKTSKSASDFFVAGRSVSVGWNASAISGEYLSAASFMGVAGMVMSSGYDALWYPVCYACGYLFLLLFIAGPLRRFGAYTIPDFAEGRYDSPVFRKIAVIFVLFIGFFYTMPQMKGAGTTLAYIFPGLPYWVGVVLVGAVITLNVALGGMKGITLVQAFQYWAKMFAISVPIFVLMSVYGGYGKQVEVNGKPSVTEDRSTASITTNAAGQLVVSGSPYASMLDFRILDHTRKANLSVAQEAQVAIQWHQSGIGLGFTNNGLVTAENLLQYFGSSAGAEVRMSVELDGVRLKPFSIPSIAIDRARAWATKRVLTDNGISVLADNTGIVWAAPVGRLEDLRTLIRKEGRVVRDALPPEGREALSPKAPADTTWLNPFGPLTTKAAKAAKLDSEQAKPYALLYTYSLIIALVCGTAGLPHILVRFYTNPDGVAAKRTTMWVMILIGIFYVFPPVFGVMGRNLMPSLYEGTGAKGTDKVVLELPRILNEGKVGGSTNAASLSPAPSPTFPPAAGQPQAGSTAIPWGSILSGITCAGAFAAFMSTFSGLLVSMTGALAHDVYGRMLRPNSTPAERMRMFKFCAVAVGTVAVVLGSFVEPLQINFMVGQAFAIAAASYFPLLFMSVWWRGMTMRGAAAGMLTGGVCALAAVTLTNFSDLKWIALGDFWAAHPLLRILCEQPAIWTVPLAIGLMVAVSKLTRATVPADVRMKMLVLHAPEKLGLKQEYIKEHEAHGH
jgi:Na+(H+)/acetate symporter ActP